MTTKTKTTWRTVRLGDVASKITKGTTPTTLGKPFARAGINFIKAESITDDGRFIPNKFEHIDEETNSLLKRSIIQEYDLLYSIAGVIGRPALVAKKILPANTNQALAIIRPNQEEVEPKFLYYFLSSKAQKQYANNLVAQSAQPNINLEQVSNLEFQAPELAEQKRIAGVLAAFDEKIENNNRIIKILEEMAQAIFKKWFVNNVSDGEAVSFVELADFVNGGAFGKIVNRNRKGLPLVKIAEFSRGISENTEWINEGVPGKYLVKNGDLLFSWSGSLELHIWHKGDAVLNQHLFNVVPKDSHTRGFLYVVLRSVLPWFRQIAQSKATSMGHIQRHHLEEQEIFIPSDKDLSIFDEIYQKLVSVLIENQKLAAMRDLLLPRLMSGEIRI